MKKSEIQFTFLNPFWCQCQDGKGKFMHVLNIFLPPAKEVWGKVMFLNLCVILFTGEGGSAHPLL